MSWSELALVVLGALAVGLLFAWQGDAQLVRRASAAVELAASGVLDPASAVLVADAAYAVSDVGAVTSPVAALQMDGLSRDRERAESGLTATLREALPAGGVGPRDGSSDDGTSGLVDAWYRATLARRFHNEAVAQTRRVRRLWYVRWFWLAGRAPMPRTVELDDALPDGLDPAGA